jgi:hypothetical protein
MQEHISDKLLSQNSENVQKLFDLTTRIDERVILLQNKEEGILKEVDAIEEALSDRSSDGDEDLIKKAKTAKK